MRTPPYPQEFLNKRRLLLFIPLPGVICLTVLFYLGGGGRGVPAATAGPGSSGLNRTLPAVGKTSLFADKLKAYQAAPDSAHRNGLAFAPPTETPEARPDPGAGSAGGAPAGLNYAVQPGHSSRYEASADPNVVALQSRMQRLQRQTSAPAAYPATAYSAPAPALTASRRGLSAAAPARDERLEESLRELDQLRSQYQQRLQALNTPTGSSAAAPAAAPATAPVVASSGRPPRERSMSVITQVPRSVVSSLGGPEPASAAPGGFHTIGEERSSRPALNAVPAVIHDEQVVSQGSTVKMRLLEDVQLEGRLVPRNSFLYGVCSVSGNRLTINATQVQYQGSLLPVSLKAFDLDGGEGLNIPGSVDRDALKQGAATGAGSADLLTLSPSLGAQAAGIALQTGKALAGRKIRLVRIHLKANYHLLLKS